MSWKPSDLRSGQPKRGDQADHGPVPCAIRGLATYKRAWVLAPLVSAPMTSAHVCGGRWSRLGRAVASDRCRGFSVTRPRVSVDHNSRGKKE